MRKKLSEQTKEKVKVYSHSGATIEDVKHHLHAHLRKKPTHLILQVGTNDAQNKQVTSDHIYDGLLNLKSFAESMVPGIHVTISCPIVRSDNKWANEKLIRVKERLIDDNKERGMSIIINENITYGHLSTRGLHLKQHGTNLLSDNVGNFINSLNLNKFKAFVKESNSMKH